MGVNGNVSCFCSFYHRVSWSSMSLLHSKYFLLDQWYFGAQQGEVNVNRDPLLKIYNDSGSDFYLEGEPRRLCTFQSRGPYVVFLEFCISSRSSIVCFCWTRQKIWSSSNKIQLCVELRGTLEAASSKPYSIGFALICPIEFSIYTFRFDKHWTNNWQH